MVSVQLFLASLQGYLWCKATASNADLSLNEFFCLIIIDIKRPCCVRKLNEELCLHAPATSKILNALEQKGLIDRRLDEHDKRMERVTLTVAGIDRCRRIHEATEATWNALSLEVPEERRSAFLECLQQMTRNTALENRTFSIH